jgi:hypothetical protein
MSRETLSSVDSANGFADSELGYPSRGAGVEFAPAPAQNSADRSSKWPPPIRYGAAPRIHGEREMLGMAISERTVSRFLRSVRGPPNQT